MNILQGFDTSYLFVLLCLCFPRFSFNDFDCGGRLCTCLVYLNDSEQSLLKAEELCTRNTVTEGREHKFTGGETMFPEFHAAIQPKKGSALFFFNTLERPGSSNYNSEMFLNVDRKLRHAGKSPWLVVSLTNPKMTMLF